MRFDFEAERPPVLTEASLQAELEKRQLEAQTVLLAAAGILSEFCLLLTAVILFPVCLPAALFCTVCAVCAAAGGGILAVVCHAGRGGSVMAAAGASVILILAGLVLIPVMVGIYVWRDATKRGMNPVLWTLVAAAAPAYSGFLIYLLVRGKYDRLQCPSCGTGVKRSDTSCPVCGAMFRLTCASCGYPLEDGWTVCPVCAAPLEADRSRIVTPVRRQDRVLLKLLLILVLIPALILLFLVVINWSSVRVYRFHSQMSSYTEEDMALYEEIPEVWNWMEESRQKDPEGIYVLRFQEESYEGRKTVYLIYRPSAGNMRSNSMHTREGFLQDILEVSFEDTDDPSWGHAYFPMECVTDLGSEYVGLSILLNGEEVSYEMKQIGFDPSLDLEEREGLRP